MKLERIRVQISESSKIGVTDRTSPKTFTDHRVFHHREDGETVLYRSAASRGRFR